jgi:hypothetical protein
MNLLRRFTMQTVQVHSVTINSADDAIRNEIAVAQAELKAAFPRIQSIVIRRSVKSAVDAGQTESAVEWVVSVTHPCGDFTGIGSELSEALADLRRDMRKQLGSTARFDQIWNAPGVVRSEPIAHLPGTDHGDQLLYWANQDLVRESRR